MASRGFFEGFLWGWGRGEDGFGGMGKVCRKRGGCVKERGGVFESVKKM